MQPHRIDPRSLSLFLAVAEAGSITAGAQQVHLSVAAASTRLQELEQLLGVTLLQRSRQGITLSGAGTELLSHARLVLGDLERLQQAMSPFSSGLRGRVTLLANTAAAHGWLPQALSSYLQQHPGVDVDLQEMSSQDILFALRQGEADAGLLSEAVDTEGLRTWPLYTDRLVVAGSPEHVRALPEMPSLRDCATHPLVSLQANTPLTILLQRKAAEAGASLHHRIRLPSPQGQLALAAKGAGLAIASLRAVLTAQAAGHALAHRPLCDTWATRHILLGIPAVHPSPDFVQELLDAIRQFADENRDETHAGVGSGTHDHAPVSPM
jgi:molybdate transport repressor ModE-like protein